MSRLRIGRVRGREVVHTFREGFSVGVVAKVEVACGCVGQCRVKLVAVF